MRWSWLGLSLLASCGATTVPGPAIEAITPNAGAADVGHGLTIRGRFSLVSTVDFAKGTFNTNRSHAAWLGATQLTAVTYVDETTLVAQAPAGLAVGGYDLTVQGPTGSRATLPSAYTAVDSCAGVAGCEQQSTVVDLPDDPVDPDNPPTEVNRAPDAALVVTPSAVEVGEEIIADAGATADDNDALSSLVFLFDFADGTTPAASGSATSHVYAAPGTYRLTVVAQDTSGALGYAAFDVEVQAAGTLVRVITGGDDATTPPLGSLRAATEAAANTSEREVIYVPRGVTIQLVKSLRITTDVTLIGDEAVISGAGIGSTTDCLILDSDDIVVEGFEIINCPASAIGLKSGSGMRVTRCRLHDNGDAVSWTGAGNTFGPGNEVVGSTGVNADGFRAAASAYIVGNSFHDHQGCGVSVAAAASASVIEKNRFWGNAEGGLCLGVDTTDVSVRFNTIDANATGGVVVDASCTAIQIGNNAITNNEGVGVMASSGAASLSFFDYNAFFGNTVAACDGCVLGANDVQTEVGYVDGAAHDYRLLPGSALVDKGADMDIDVNGVAPGSYNGAAPDIGFWESP